MKRGIILAIILAGMLVFSACGVTPRNDDRTQINIDITGDFAVNYAIVAAQPYTYYLILTVSAPDIDPPLVFVNADYQLGTDWPIEVPNGYGRVFELIIYELQSGVIPVGGFSNLTTFKPLVSSGQRTFDLTGVTINIPFPMQKVQTGYIGTNLAGLGLIKIDQNGDVVPVKNCAYTLKAYLIDSEMPDTELGPTIINMAAAGNPGEYLLGGIPVNKNLKLKVVRPETGWTGISEPFVINPETPLSIRAAAPATLNTAMTIIPVDVLLSGWQDLKVIPADFPVPDGDLGYMTTFRAVGGWQTADGNSVSNTLLNACTPPPLPAKKRSGIMLVSPTFYCALLAPLSGGTVGYEVTGYYGSYYGLGLYGANTVDEITVSENCSPDSSASAKAWWYRKPMVDRTPEGFAAVESYKSGSWYYDSIPLAGGTVFVYGYDFDNPASHASPPLAPAAAASPHLYPQPFLDVFGTYGLMTPISGSEYDFDFKAYSSTFGKHPFWVRNYRTNPLIPGFEGFFDSLEVWYSNTAGGAF